MKTIVVVAFSLCISACLLRPETRDQQFKLLPEKKLSILLKMDGTCFMPQSGLLSVKTIQCTYKIDGKRIQFFNADGSGGWATITDDCIEFSNVKYCTDRSQKF